QPSRTGAGARADRLLPGAPGQAEVPALDRLHGRVAPPADRQAVQAAAARQVLGRGRQEDLMIAPPRGAEDLTPQWLSAALAGESGGAVVTDVDARRIGTGQVADSIRLAL